MGLHEERVLIYEHKPPKIGLPQAAAKRLYQERPVGGTTAEANKDQDMTLRFGGNTFSYMWSSTATDALAELADLGLNDFDVLVTPIHLWPWDMDKQARASFASSLRARGIRIESLNPPALDYNLGSLVPEVRAAAVGLYEETIRLAADLGAAGVVVVPGRVSALLPPPGHVTNAHLVDTIGQLARLAEGLGLKLHLETHPLTSVPRVPSILELVHSVGSKSVGVAYDLSNAEFIGEDQAEAIRLLGKHLTQIHVSDGTKTSWLHAAVGDGTVNFDTAFAAAEEIKFAGVAIIELISPEPKVAYSRSILEIERIRPVRDQSVSTKAR